MKIALALFFNTHITPCMNPAIVAVLVALLVALLKIRRLITDLSVAQQDATWSHGQIQDRSNRILSLENKFNKLLAECARSTIEIGKLRAELKRKHRRATKL